MKNAGKLFEEDFKKSVPDNIYYYRLKDASSSWSNDGTSRFTPKNPFDSILYKYPIMFQIELKSTKGSSISFGGQSKMIKEHQINSLTESSKHFGITAGFIFNFRTYNNATYFMHIIDFNNFLERTTKLSINLNDIENFGGIAIENNLLKKRYRYNIKLLVNDLIEKMNNMLLMEEFT